MKQICTQQPGFHPAGIQSILKIVYFVRQEWNWGSDEFVGVIRDPTDLKWCSSPSFRNVFFYFSAGED